MRLIDTHTHLVDKVFNDDRREIIDEMARNSIGALVCGTEVVSSHDAVRYCATYKNLYPTVGIHPLYTEDADLKEIKKLAQDPSVVAIGEIGIDYWHLDEKEEQTKIFIQQLDLAAELGKPVVIHTRGSKEAPDEIFEDLYKILVDYQGKLTGVVHSYAGDEVMAQKFIDLGFLLGFNGIITFDKTGRSAKVIKSIPLDKILVETDSPYLTPPPHRGKRNNPNNVIYVAGKIAEITGKSVEEVCRITTLNAQELFKLS
jgi:TatD DNase family protein